MGRFKQVQIDVDVNRAIERERQSFGESENDILRRILLPNDAKNPVSVPDRPRDGPIRTRGHWAIEINGQREPAANLKDAYRLLLIKLSEMNDEFLNDFAKEASRSRRFVARKASDLYTGSPHLAKDHGRPLTDGWYFDTNLSTEQVSTRVRIAARLCGLRYGSDIKLISNLGTV